MYTINAVMPEICRFFGIIIAMFGGDHNLPHFHVKYGDYNAIVLLNGEVLCGEMPVRVIKLLSEWVDLHRDELMENWQRLQRGEEAIKIKPLES